MLQIKEYLANPEAFAVAAAPAAAAEASSEAAPAAAKEEEKEESDDDMVCFPLLCFRYMNHKLICVKGLRSLRLSVVCLSITDLDGEKGLDVLIDMHLSCFSTI